MLLVLLGYSSQNVQDAKGTLTWLQPSSLDLQDHCLPAGKAALSAVMCCTHTRLPRRNRRSQPKQPTRQPAKMLAKKEAKATLTSLG